MYADAAAAAVPAAAAIPAVRADLRPAAGPANGAGDVVGADGRAPHVGPDPLLRHPIRPKVVTLQTRPLPPVGARDGVPARPAQPLESAVHASTIEPRDRTLTSACFAPIPLLPVGAQLIGLALLARPAEAVVDANSGGLALLAALSGQVVNAYIDLQAYLARVPAFAMGTGLRFLTVPASAADSPMDANTALPRSQNAVSGDGTTVSIKKEVSSRLLCLPTCHVTATTLQRDASS